MNHRAAIVLLAALLLPLQGMGPWLQAETGQTPVAAETRCVLPCCDGLSGPACCCFQAPDKDQAPVPVAPLPSGGSRDLLPRAVGVALDADFFSPAEPDTGATRFAGVWGGESRWHDQVRLTVRYRAMLI